MKLVTFRYFFVPAEFANEKGTSRKRNVLMLTEPETSSDEFVDKLKATGAVDILREYVCEYDVDRIGCLENLSAEEKEEVN